MRRTYKKPEIRVVRVIHTTMLNGSATTESFKMQYKTDEFVDSEFDAL